MIRNLLVLAFSYILSRAAFSFITVDITNFLLKTVVETGAFIVIFMILYNIIKPQKNKQNH